MRGVDPGAPTLWRNCATTSRGSILPIPYCPGYGSWTAGRRIPTWPSIPTPGTHRRRSASQEIGLSTRRLARVLPVYGEVLNAACNRSFPEEGKDLPEGLDYRRVSIFAEVDRLESSDCPRDVR